MGQGTESLSSQVEALLGGKLVIPSIQRGYVWRRSQVSYLLDSLYRGFPVGALLIWKTQLDVPLRPADVLQGSHAYDTPAVLLDGQQRLTSIAKVMRPDAVKGAPLDVRFDPREEQFLNPSAVQRKDPMLFKVSELLAESPQFASMLMNVGVQPGDPNFDMFYARLQKVHAIRKYPLPILTVESDDYEEVADIFTRVNQGGRRLSKGDLVYSAVAARWPEGVQTMEAFREELDEANFAFDREAILRLMGLLAGTGAQSIKLIAKSVTGDDLKAAWGRTEDALRRVVDFLRGECSIPRVAALTSSNVAVIPAYFLHLRKGSMTAEEADGLRRWVYTAMAFSHYSSQVESKLDAEARVVARGGSGTFADLIRRASGPRSPDIPLSPSDLEHRSSNSPLFTLLYIAALRRGAKDWHSNTALSAQPMTSTSKIEFHHIFPKATVQSRYGHRLTNSLANLAFISATANKVIGAKKPENYLPTVHPDRLAEQWVPGPETWSVNAFEQFLAMRREAQVAALNEPLGLPPYDPARSRGPEAELPVDDDEVAADVEQSG